MLETKEQKQIFTGCLILIVILSVVSFWQRPAQTPGVDYNALSLQSKQEQAAYDKYLVSIQTTPEAQAALYEQILPPEEVKAEVSKELDSGQPVAIPMDPQTKIHLVSTAGASAVAGYVNATAPIIDKIQSSSDAAQEDFFNPSGSIASVDALIQTLQSSLASYSKIAVPKEAGIYQAKQLIVLEAYLDLAKTSKTYMQDSSTDPWPQMYKDYAIMSEVSAQAGQSFQDLNTKYNLVGDVKNRNDVATGNFLVPAAHAQVGGLVVDVWAKAEEVARIAAATAVARFMLAFLDLLANKIQQTYTISNYLYYTDALVSGQYVDDYLNKYVSDPVDRAITKNFIPALSCGKTQDLSAVYQAKARQYLGFDPNSLDPNDPNYYQKLARVGDFFSSPQGWESYYQGLAAQADSSAQQAANNELNSQGFKSARDVTGSIIKSAQTTVSSLQAVLKSELEFGIPGTSGDPFTAKVATTITNEFLNKFVFQGTVLKEQKACIAVPLVTLVTPVPVGTPPDVAPAQ